MFVGTSSKILVVAPSEEVGDPKASLLALVNGGTYQISSQPGSLPRVTFRVALVGSREEFQERLWDTIRPYFPQGAEINFS